MGMMIIHVWARKRAGRGHSLHWVRVLKPWLHRRKWARVQHMWRHHRSVLKPLHLQLLLLLQV